MCLGYETLLMSSSIRAVANTGGRGEASELSYEGSIGDVSGAASTIRIITELSLACKPVTAPGLNALSTLTLANANLDLAMIVGLGYLSLH